MPRHGSNNLTKNQSELYEEFFEERGLTRITHYRTPKWPPLTAKIRSQFVRIRHSWKLGDRYWKLASKHYGDPKLWWVIAWYNEKPTEAHVKTGATIMIPKPVDRVLSYFNFGSS
jgi:nucleoid-associated protein YgaU